MASFPPSRALMGPGPSDVHPRILAAMARPTVGHLDPWFVDFMEDMKAGLRLIFRTRNDVTLPVSAPGSAGMECCFANLVEPDDKVIVCENGVFGGRMRENIERAGGIPVSVKNDWGRPVDPGDVEQAILKNGTVKILAFVHAETSTGVESDAATLCKIAEKYGLLTIVDAVTSLGGIPVEVDKWGVDAIYSGSQKCLSAPPGLSPVSFSARAMEKVRARKHKVRSWFLDLTLLTGYWQGEGGRSYHHTAPINALYGLQESLMMVEEEGLEKAWVRHRHMHKALKAGLDAMGLPLIVDEQFRLPQLNAVKIPDGVDEAAVRKFLLDHYDLEIGAGLGSMKGKIWRIGLMGHSARAERVLLCLVALEDALASCQAPINRGVAVAAAQAVL